MQRTGRVLEGAREALRDGEPPRQEDAEGRPASAGTLELDSTVMGFDDLPHHEQSEPHARNRLLREADAPKRLEDPLSIVLRDTDPSVGDPQLELRFVRLERHLDRAPRRRVLDGIADQVDEDLLDA